MKPFLHLLSGALLVAALIALFQQHLALTQATQQIRVLNSQRDSKRDESSERLQPNSPMVHQQVDREREELLRLRNEVRQLREVKADSEKLRVENEELRNAIALQREVAQTGWSNLVAGARSNGIRSASVALLVQALTNESPGIRLESTKALREIGLQKWLDTNLTAESDAQLRTWAKSAVPALVQSLKDPDTFVRANAAITLGFLGHESGTVVPALVQALQDSEGRVGRSAAKALGRMRADAQPAIPNLLQAAQSADPQMRTVAIDALRQIDPQALQKAGLQ